MNHAIYNYFTKAITDWNSPRGVVVRDFGAGVGHRDTRQLSRTTLHTLRYFYTSLSVRLPVHMDHTPHCTAKKQHSPLCCFLANIYLRSFYESKNILKHKPLWSSCWALLLWFLIWILYYFQLGKHLIKNYLSKLFCKFFSDLSHTKLSNLMIRIKHLGF